MSIEEMELTTAEHQEPATVRAKERSLNLGHLVTLERATVVALILIVALGAYFRFSGLNWDNNHHLHPDERFLTDVASKLETVSDPLVYLRTSESPLNPYNLDHINLFVYGNFPMTVTRYVAEWINGTCDVLFGPCGVNYTGYDGIHLVGRALSGLVDLASLIFIFLIGRRLYDWRAGLLGALLFSLAVMPIQQSHFFTMDNWAAALSTAAIYMAVRASEAGDRKRWWVLFGLFLGLAVASRINVAPLAGMSVVAAAAWLGRRQRHLAPEAGWRFLLQGQGAVDLQRVLLGLLVAAAVSLVTFRLAQPYAFMDGAMVRETVLNETGREPSSLRIALQSILGPNPQWLANLREIQGLQSPEASFPPAVQWTGRAPLLYPMSNMVLYGMGLAAGIAALTGFFWAFWRLVRARPDWTAHALPVAWAGGYFLFMGVRWVKSIRYFLPVYPFLLLLGAWALVRIWDKGGPNGWRKAAVALLISLAVVPTFLWADAFTEIYRQPMTRIAASRWMFENIPSGATLLYEANGEQRTLPLPLKGYELRADAPPLTLTFTLPEEGSVSGVRLNYVTLPAGAKSVVSLSITQADGAEVQQGRHDIVVSGRRQPVELPLQAQALPAQQRHILRVEHAGGGPILADTSRIVNEEWDDLLPVNVDGKAAYASYYSEVSGGQRPLPWPASEEKRRLMLQWLEEADVIALSSQRALWSTPRLPLTYPLNVAYYRSLFNGELGFKLVAQFHADLHVGPLYISDTGGELGWGAPPQIGWPPPGELAAEEAFSVYDHPPVWIFRKSDAYSSQRAATILNDVDLNNVVAMSPGDAGNAPNGLMLTPRLRQIQRNNGTFSQVFRVDGILSQQPAVGAVVWWISTVLLGWLAFPLAYVALGGLPKRGYALARILGLLFVSWVAWLIASYEILPHTRGLLWLSVLLLFLLSAAVVWRYRQSLLAFVRRNVAYIGFVEAFGLLLFLVGIAIRLGNPDVWDVIWGGEKPMDLSYFTAVVKSTTFPPYDPWFAGGYINYYYYGFVFVGALTELLGIVPTVAYNLILPTLFSFTGLGAFSIAYNLVTSIQSSEPGEENGTFGNPLSRAGSWLSALGSKALLAGVSAALLCVFLGNLGEVGVLLGAWQRAGQDVLNTGVGVVDAAARTLDGAVSTTLGGQEAPIYPGDWFWTATRAININEGETAPITEFPFFTFLYGDLHAHMIALPLTVLALGWAVSLALSTNRPGFGDRAGFLRTTLLWFVGALGIGVLRATNTWDWPTYLFIGILAVIFRAVRRHGGQLQLRMLAQALVQVAALAALSTLLFWPYVASYGAGYESLRFWEGSYTHVSNYFVIYGLFLFIILTFLAREFRSWAQTWTRESLLKLRPFTLPLLLASFVYVVLLAFLLVQNYWIAPIVLTLVVLSGVLGLRPGIGPARRALLVMVSAALGLTLLVEAVVLEGDIGRMNTVFKFYMQVWVLLSIAAGAALAFVWPAIRRRRSRLRSLWQGTLLILVAAALLYPLLATPARWRVRMSDQAPHTLNGMAFMETTRYGDATYDGSSVMIDLDGEYEALRWMQRNVQGSPVVAEASPPNVGEAYRSIASRVAMYTGLPLVIGWDWHQMQQRAALPGSLIRERMNDVDMLYRSPDPAQAMDIVDEYGISYIYLGTQERLYYPAQGLGKFAQMTDAGLLRQVFDNEDVTIYRVVN